MAKNKTITVLGAGLWGTVLAQHLARAGRAVYLWEFFPEAARRLQKSRRHPHLPGMRLADSITVTSDFGSVSESSVVLFVLPSHHMRETAKSLRPLMRGSKAVIINASKGIEPVSLLTQSEVIASQLPGTASRIYTLSGPSFAREVARGVPTQLLLAGPSGTAVGDILALFNGGAIKTQWCADRKGVEIGGSLKNVLAIGCGMLDGLKTGANTKAALIVQGLREMGDLALGFGGKAETVYGLAGLGDLIATGTSEESRNRAFGEKLGQGLSLKNAKLQIATVVEGIEAAESARSLARRAKLKAPLIESIWKVVHAGRHPRIVVKALGFKEF